MQGRTYLRKNATALGSWKTTVPSHASATMKSPAGRNRSASLASASVETGADVHNKSRPQLGAEAARPPLTCSLVTAIFSSHSTPTPSHRRRVVLEHLING